MIIDVLEIARVIVIFVYNVLFVSVVTADLFSMVPVVYRIVPLRLIHITIKLTICARLNLLIYLKF